MIKKSIPILLLAALFSFKAGTPPTTIKVELTVEEAQTIINALGSSESVSAKASNNLINKIDAAYKLALADTTKKDSTHKK